MDTIVTLGFLGAMILGSWWAIGALVLIVALFVLAGFLATR